MNNLPHHASDVHLLSPEANGQANPGERKESNVSKSETPSAETVPATATPARAQQEENSAAISRHGSQKESTDHSDKENSSKDSSTADGAHEKSQSDEKHTGENGGEDSAAAARRSLGGASETNEPSKFDLGAFMKRFFNKFLESSFYSKFFVVTVLFHSMLVACLEGSLYSVFEEINGGDYQSQTNASAEASAIPVYLVIFVIANVFQLLVCLDSVYFRNILEVLAFTIFNVLLFVYSIFQIFQLRDLMNAIASSDSVVTFDDFSPILITISASFGVFEVAYIFFLYQLHREYGWDLYEKIGGDIQMLNMHKLIETFVVFIKFCSFFSIGFLLQYGILILDDNDPEKGVSFCAIPCIVFILVFTIRCIKHENRILALCSIILQSLGIVYFCYKLAKMYSNTTGVFTPFIKFLTFFDVLSILCLSVTVTLTTRCLLNFGKGIKERARLVRQEKRDSRINLEQA